MGMRMRPSRINEPPASTRASTRSRRRRCRSRTPGSRGSSGSPRRADERADPAPELDEFVEIFGTSTDSYTSASVYGFFQNGGTDCWVARVAHAAPKGEHPGMDHAACAEHVQIDDWNKPSLKIRALDEGTWGNTVWFRCVHTPGAQALLTRDLDIGAGEAHVNSTRGFEVGSLVKIHDRENSDFVVISEVADKLIKWSTETPVNRRHRAAAPTHLDVMTFEIHVAMRDRREVFKNLQMHPSSKNYAPRVVSQRSRLVRLEDLATKSPVPHNLPEALPMTRLAGWPRRHRHGHARGLHRVRRRARRARRPARARRQRGDRAARDPRRDAVLRQGARPRRRAQGAAPAGHPDLDLREPEGPVRDPRHSAEQGHRVGPAVAPPHRQLLLRVLLALAPGARPGRPDPGRAALGFLEGCYARRDLEGVHHAPANLEIEGVQDVSLRITEDHIGILNSDSVNTFRLQRGVPAWGARTASSDPQWRYISVRRLFIMLRRSLEAGFAWITFEPNNERTWDLVKGRTMAFLSDLHNKGMLVGGNPEQAFFVKCDAETNPPEQVDSGLLICDIGVAPVSPAEFIMISLVQTMTGPSPTT